MILEKVPMIYDRELERWVAEGADEWYGLRCGEGIKIHFGKQLLQGRLEMGLSSWIIISDEIRFGLLKSQKYTVTVHI